MNGKMRFVLDVTLEERFALMSLVTIGASRDPRLVPAARKLLAVLEGEPSRKPKRKKRKVSRSDFLRAALAANPRALNHTLTSVRALREILGWPKRSFDAYVKSLERKGHVVLHFHDHPRGLTTEDRKWLVDGRDGDYYVGLVFEEDHWR